MWSWSLAASENRLKRNDEELARYARWEYGESDGGWLVAQARREARNGSWRGLRRWFSSLLGRETRSESMRSRERASDGEMRTANDGGVLLTEAIPREDCAHDNLKSLGGGGNAAYYRCQACARVMIAQGGKRWVLRPPAEE